MGWLGSGFFSEVGGKPSVSVAQVPKTGEVVPEALSESEALTAMCATPLLIRRPLMEVGDERMVGFDPAAVDRWIGLNNVELPAGNIEACVHGPAGHGSCGSHEHEEAEHAGCATH